MPNFSTRSETEELLDQPGIPSKALFQNLKELENINRLLGGHAATLYGLKQLLIDKTKTYTIVDYACGGGDTLREIERWANRNAYKVKLIGFDILPEAIEFAKKRTNSTVIDYRVSDFSNFSLQADIAICSLVCHHFYNGQLEQFIKKMASNSSLGVVINDLHRHPLAYYSIALLTLLFSKSYLVKNDAKLSVLKGFTKKEWQHSLQQYGITQYSIRWIWAFRHAIVIRNGA